MSQQREVRVVPFYQFPGWQMAVAGTVHGFAGYGFWLYGWSVFVPTLQRIFRFTSAEIGFIRTLTRLDAGIEGIFTGWALDKWGPRFTAIFGFVYCTLGWLVIAQLGAFEAAFGREGALVAMWIAYALVIQNAMGISLYTTSYPAINRWFVRRRANAMGIIAIGAGAGGALFVPLTAWLMEQWGYAGAAYGMAAVNMFILTPVALLFRPHPPEHYGFLPDNVTTEVAQSEARLARAIDSQVKFVDYTLGESLRTFAFWCYCIAASTAGYGSTALTLFQNIRMQAVGYTLAAAANFYGFQFAMTVVGRVIIAILGELWDPYHVMWVTHAIMTVGLLFFAVGTQDWHFYAWAIIYGIPYGAWAPSIGTWRGSYFGRAHIGKIYGWIQAITATIGVPAGLAVGWMIDVAGYETTFLIGVGAYALASVLYILARRPRRQPSPGAIKRAAKEAEEEFRRQQQAGGS